MPRFVIESVEFDGGNEPHVTRRGLSAEDVRWMLLGPTVATVNKKTGSAQYLVTASAPDGSRWRIPFNYDPATRTARPITAIPA